MMIPFLVPAAFSILLAVSAPAATDKHDHDRSDQVAARAALARGEILPIGRILRIATAHVPGDVLKVELKRKSFGFQYKVKILAANGRLREVEINAKTGALISIEED